MENVKTEKVSRRTFLNLLLTLSGLPFLAGIVYPVARYLWPVKQKEAITGAFIEAAKAGELKPNASKTFQFGGKPAMLIQTKEGNYKAYVATCTHLACTVQYRKEKGDIWCACHNGVYDIEGKNVSGPPPRPLTPLKVVVRGKSIMVSLT